MKLQVKLGFILVIFLLFPISSLAASGYFVHGAGAVNEALGGAATAGNNQDLLGSLYRNPANAKIFKEKSACINIGAIFPDITVDSSVNALGLKGSSDTTNDAIPLCNLGVVFSDNSSPFAGYIALIGESGISLKVPQSSTNPVFMAQAGKPDNPFGGQFGGFGSVQTQIELVRIAFGVAYKLNDKFTLGISVAPSVSRLKFTPAAFAAPDDADGNGIYTYPTDVDHAFALGMGFQVGIRYQATKNLAFGLAYTSPTWFEEFEWDVSDELGNKRKISFLLNRPMTVHLGASYNITDDTLILLDGSWINYSGTKGFDECYFDVDGSLQGLGWDDQWVIALGVQHDISDSWALRAGYNYSSSPIDDELTFFNISTPLHLEHHISLGASWKISSDWVVDIGYTHSFRSSQSGTWYNDKNEAVPGTDVETTLYYDQLSVGVTFSF